ncbi:MAG: hypothetical protein LBG91_04300, partial [Treponema sp.]|nr:hypothetical protein [Treponema sp.]
MKTNFQQAQTFLVLVPHRDVRLKLRKWSGSLFMAGIQGAYHFPWAAPLALLTRPLDTPELKHCARILRDTAGGVKISARECSCAALPLTGKDRPVIFGPRLDLALPPN